MTEDENKFYESIRSILNEGTEEVPEGLWNAIESRLPAARPRIVPVFLKILAPTAAAAAVVTAVLLSPFGNNTSPAYDHTIARLDESGYGNPAAVIAAVPQAAALRNDVFVITDAATASSAADSPVQEETVGHDISVQGSDGISAQDADDISARDAGEGSAKDSGAVHARKQETAEAAGTATDKTSGQRTEEADDLFGFDFPDEGESGPRNRIRTAVTLSGNAISNTNSTRNNDATVPMSFRPSQKTELKERISESSESAFGIPLTFGVGVKISFTPRWALGVGVNYTNLSRTFDGAYYRVIEGQDYQTPEYFSNIRNRQDYIGIPVNVYFNILQGDFINFYAYAGGTAEKCISNRFFMSNEMVEYTHKEAVKGIQWSADLGIGLEFVIARQFGLYIDPSLRYYFGYDGQPRSIRSLQPLMFGVEMGLRVHL